jgi:hypothetical protein
MMLHERVAVWLDERGVPRRLVYAGERYRVSDAPTVLPAAPINEWTMHPPTGLGGGWRFQATTITGDCRVFDVRLDAARNEWVLVHTYE